MPRVCTSQPTPVPASASPPTGGEASTGGGERRDARPEDGFKYLTVQCDGTEGDDVLSQIESSPCPDSKNQHRIHAVIGKESDIGVENLLGSGLIAGETSAAYRGSAHLLSGHRPCRGDWGLRYSGCRTGFCQVDNSHIILTSAPALNSVLGRRSTPATRSWEARDHVPERSVLHSVVKTKVSGGCF